MRTFWPLSIVAVLALTGPGFAQKLVEPKMVAPEYREAAEKRRAEQIRQFECRKKVEATDVLPRDRTAAIMKCIEDGSNPTTAAAHQ